MTADDDPDAGCPGHELATRCACSLATLCSSGGHLLAGSRGGGKRGPVVAVFAGVKRGRAGGVAGVGRGTFF